jgi:transcriptional regulator with XRE-family HTH domain
MSRIAYICAEMYDMRDMTAPTLAQIGSDLKTRRRARGWTQAELARRTRLSRALVVRAEQGDPTIAIGSFLKLFGATGAELRAETKRMPTLEEVGELFRDE